MSGDRARDLDTVELLKEVDGWRAGTIGVVVAEHPKTALVEVAVENGEERDLFDDLVDVPYGDLRVIQPAQTSARAAG